MNFLFRAVDTLSATPGLDSVYTGGIFGGLFAIIAGFFIVFLIITIGIYVYSSLVFMAIGKKAGLNTPGLAWIPSVGPLIIAYQSSKLHWWPWLLLIGYPLAIVSLMAGEIILGTIGALVGIIAMLVFIVFAFIWQWKMLETVGKPGWWVLLCLIPGVGVVIYLILLGITAWGDSTQTTSVVPTSA